MLTGLFATAQATASQGYTLNLNFLSGVLDPRITFSRGTQATYFDSTGTLRYANNNLVTYSEDFANAAWLKSRLNASTPVIVNAIAAPDGTITADKMVEDNTASSTHYLYANNVAIVAATQYTFSVYLKAAERTFAAIELSDGPSGLNGGLVGINLTTGAIGTPFTRGSGSNVTASATDAGNGWWRVRVSVIIDSSSTSADCVVYTATSLLTSGFPSYTGDNTSGIYIWGAMLNIGSTVGNYVQTVASAYYAPRFDTNPSTLAPLGLLIEEQRTNSIRNNTMQGAVAGTPGTLPTNWNASALSGLTRTIVGTGTESGISYIDIQYAGTTSAALSSVIFAAFEASQQVAASSGQTWVGSGYVRLVGGSLSGVTLLALQLTERDAAGALLVASSSSIATVTNAGLSTQRFQHVRTLNNASTAFVSTDIRLSAPISTAIDITLRIGLPQLELGAFATSVIPTTTTALTRNADVASVNTLTPWYNADEGTVYVSATLLNTPATAIFGLYALSDGTNNNRIYVNTGTGSGGNINAVVTVGGVLQAQTINGSLATAGTYNYANAYKVNDFASVVNGGSAVTDNLGSIPTVDRLKLGANPVGNAGFLNGHIRRIQYYPIRINNDKLKQLTT